MPLLVSAEPGDQGAAGEGLLSFSRIRGHRLPCSRQSRPANRGCQTSGSRERPVSAECQGVADGLTLGGIAVPREGAMTTPRVGRCAGSEGRFALVPRLLECSF